MSFNSAGLTGKASIDKPWLQFYPESLRNMEIPKITLESFLRMKNPDESKDAIEYYGKRFTWKEFWQEVEIAAKALKVLGFDEGDRIPVFVQAVPAHYILLLAAEKIGAAMICRDDTPEELCFAIRKSKASTAFVHDYVSKEDEKLFRATTPMTRMIKVSPYDYADRNCIPDYIEKEIESRYPAETEPTEGDLTWDEFMNLGRNYNGDFAAPVNPNRPLFGAYTSGSTGISKLVIHSGANIVAVAYQMSVFVPASEEQETWWLPILTPALVAATISMTIFPMSAGLRVILDPFCPINDIDVRFMELKPNYWALIPMMCEILMKSDRIPEDYDMSHLRSIGPGAEPMNERKYRETEEFFHKHNCMHTLSAGYGQSEGGSCFTLPNPMFPLKDGCVGMPMPATVLSVFDSETLEEMSYGEIGEVCMNGPAKMLGYSGYMGEEMTERTLVVHPDGEIWLHTGDIGYITEQGIVHILGRGFTERFGGGYLFMMRMESRVVEAEGVKDGFFCFVPDQDHEGFFVPYLFVILDEGKSLEEVRPAILAALEEHEYPAEITVIKERPYFHFKTNRKELTAAIVARLAEKGTGKMKVTWTQNEMASGYQICYSTNSSFYGSKSIDVPSTQKLQEVIGGLKKGERYYVRVRAFNSSGSNTYYSAWSETESMIHTSITLGNVANGIEITWTKVKEASEYRVYRKKFGESNCTRIAVIRDDTTYVDTAVENGIRYCYYVVPQVAGVKAMTNIAAQMYLEAPKIEKLWNN
ncbi:MAG: AMP-binding protein [Fusicatenibacter sp.]|nr:AMP-binding protein [Fusicatenibacter sp.]